MPHLFSKALSVRLIATAPLSGYSETLSHFSTYGVVSSDRWPCAMPPYTSTIGWGRERLKWGARDTHSNNAEEKRGASKSEWAACGASWGREERGEV